MKSMVRRRARRYWATLWGLTILGAILCLASARIFPDFPLLLWIGGAAAVAGNAMVIPLLRLQCEGCGIRYLTFGNRHSTDAYIEDALKGKRFLTADHCPECGLERL